MKGPQEVLNGTRTGGGKDKFNKRKIKKQTRYGNDNNNSELAEQN